MILLDTHAWVWWAAGSRKLSGRAGQAIDQADAIGVSPISCWEVAMLVSRGRLELDREVRKWVRQALALPGVELVPVSPEIAVRAGTLDRGFPGDPADRLIAATAIDRGTPIVTKDERLRGYPGLRTLW